MDSYKGIGLYNAKRDLAWLPIPKNSTTTLNTVLDQHGFEPIRLCDNPKFWFSVFREPLERWFSGIAQYYSGTNVPPWDQPNVKIFPGPNEAFDKLELDFHSRLQVSFLDRQIDKFFIGDDIDLQVQDWLEVDPIKVRLNETVKKKSNYIVIELRKYFDSRSDRVLDYLAPDYAIWRKLNERS